MKKISLHEASGFVLRQHLGNISRQKVFIYINIGIVVLIMLAFAYFMMSFLSVNEKSFQDIFNDKIWDSIAVVAFISIPIVDRLSSIRQSVNEDNTKISKLYVICIFLAAIMIISVQICICMLMWMFAYLPMEGAISVNILGGVLVLSIIIWEMIEFISCIFAISNSIVIPFGYNILLIIILIIGICIWCGFYRQSSSEPSVQRNNKEVQSVNNKEVQSVCMQYEKLTKIFDEIESVTNSDLSKFPSYPLSKELMDSFVKDISCKANHSSILNADADVSKYSTDIELLYSNLSDEYRNWFLKKIYFSDLGQG